MTEAETRRLVAGLFRDWIAHLTTVIQTNPGRPLSWIWARPDVSDMLAQAIAQARSAVYAAVQEEWPGGADSPYRASLLADVTRAYERIPGELQEVAEVVWRAVPLVEQQRGGVLVNVAFETAQHRAAAERAAMAQLVNWLGMRNGLTVDVAGTRSATEVVLAQGAEREAAGEHLLKRWMDRGDLRVCPFCRLLTGSGPIPLGASFAPFLRPQAGHRPPRVYHDLLGPPLHPRCRCRLVLVPAGAPAGAPQGPAPAAGYVSAAEIRSLPPGRYHALVSFLRSAVLELAQVIRRLARLGRED